MLEALTDVFNIGTIVGHHFMWLRIQTSDLLPPLQVRKVHNADLLPGVLGIPMGHVIKGHKSTLICSLDCLENGVLCWCLLHVESGYGPFSGLGSGRFSSVGRHEHLSFGLFVQNEPATFASILSDCQTPLEFRIFFQ